MLIPVMECNIGFYFFEKFDKAVNTFVNARDMHAFPTIRKKSRSKMTTIIYPLERISKNPWNQKEKRHMRRPHWSTSNQKINRISFLEIIRRMWMI